MTTAISALPFFGGTLSGFDPADSNCIESTAAGAYDPNYATCALSLNVGSSGTSPTWPAAATFWMRFSFNVGIPVSGFPIWSAVQFLHTGTVVMQLNLAWSGLTFGWAIQPYTLQSGTLTQVGSNFYWYPALNFFDINVVGGSASGGLTLYSAGTRTVASGSGLNHSGWSGVDQIKLIGPPSFDGGPDYFSEVICDSTSTIGRRLRYDRLNTNSAVNTGWTGGVTNINEIPTTDNSPLTAGSASLVSTFFENGLNLGTATVLARGVSARMRTESGAGPQNIQLAIRSGATNYFSSSILANADFQASFNSWTTDPNTSVFWTDSAAASAESGVNSVT